MTIDVPTMLTEVPKRLETTKNLPPPLNTPEEAINWLQAMIRDVEEARYKCDDSHFLDMKRLVGMRRQRRAYRHFCIQYGSLLGAAGALMRCGKITAQQYGELEIGVRRLLLPSIREVTNGR